MIPFQKVKFAGFWSSEWLCLQSWGEVVYQTNSFRNGLHNTFQEPAASGSFGQCSMTFQAAEAALHLLSHGQGRWLWRGAGLWGSLSCWQWDVCTGAEFQGFVSSLEALFTTGVKTLIKAASIGAPVLLQAPKSRHPAAHGGPSRWIHTAVPAAG